MIKNFHNSLVETKMQCIRWVFSLVQAQPDSRPSYLMRFVAIEGSQFGQRLENAIVAVRVAVLMSIRLRHVYCDPEGRGWLRISTPLSLGSSPMHSVTGLISGVQDCGL
jgi:hypothetical protein